MGRNSAKGVNFVASDKTGEPTMISSKKEAQILASLMLKKGITDIVISPGSRNAPLINTFDNVSEFRCFNIVDERSAAFFAMGLALHNQRPVALACTSGSALLNYAPALSEAYYQEIPLLVLSADRPVVAIDQGEGQTMRQDGALNNVVNASFTLTGGMRDEEEVAYNTRLINQALNALNHPKKAPVHINIPFAEPLYDLVDEQLPETNLLQLVQNTNCLLPDQYTPLQETWNKAAKKMILVGQQMPNKGLEAVLNRLASDDSVVVLTETTSNIRGERIHTSIDNMVFPMDDDVWKLTPDLLITLGGQVVSKKIKSWIKEHKPAEHWHVAPYYEVRDTFRVQTHSIVAQPEDFLDRMECSEVTSDYASKWRKLNDVTRELNREYLGKQEYCDFKVFEEVLESLPDNSVLHLSNSTPVRYSQLFAMKSVEYQSNRGVSGIDGVVSTAAGYAHDSHKQNVVVTGDLAFFYDSNALWNHHLPSNLKVVLINNGGGGIFRFIDGPAQMPSSEKHFVAAHQTEAKHISKAFGVNHKQATNLDEAKEGLAWLMNESNAAVLEVFTPAEKNADVLRNYFKFLKNKIQNIQL
ncbi:2-succinyl-5-enolpyruvyl-6-hydroxy-3-cyclohexene-1-carboxylic-acid synthase [Prolixibacteraceae bacterium JC049]|nr:2-succinyl-5-enolpyruvyl-6-hydroxy-3-cyclohexene-1-carboxylic-acid synthase [Prolixibacteraceae bacterium JC049]